MKANTDGKASPSTAVAVVAPPEGILKTETVSEAVSQLVSGKKKSVRLHLEYQDPLEVELSAFLKSRVLGQEAAMEKIAKTVASRIAQVGDRDAPLAVIYAGGPTGVGKTETALALAEFFLSDSKGYTKIHGEDYQDHHTSRNLFGSPKSYVGYDDPPKFNEADLCAAHKKALESGKTHQSVSALPKFSIVLVDEADKMHRSICQNFLGIFDKGEFELPTGSENNPELTYSKHVDFRQTIFLLTSNAWESERREHLERPVMGFAPQASHAERHEESEAVIKKALRGRFSPEFVERIDLMLSYKPLTNDIAEGIARREIDRLRGGFIKRKTGNSVSLDVRSDTISSIAKAGLDPKLGARNFKRFFDAHLIQPVRGVVLSGQVSGIPGGMTATIKVEGPYDALNISLTSLKARESVLANPVEALIESKRNSVIGRIRDVHAKLTAYRRIYELAFREHFSMSNEAARLEKELLEAGIPQAELETIRDEVVEEIDRKEREAKAEEALGMENVPYEAPLPDASELFYPISPEAVYSIINFFIVNAEKPLKVPQLAELRNGLIIKMIYDECEILLWGKLTKDQYDAIRSEIHRAYLRMKGKTK